MLHPRILQSYNGSQLFGERNLDAHDADGFLDELSTGEASKRKVTSTHPSVLVAKEPKQQNGINCHLIMHVTLHTR